MQRKTLYALSGLAALTACKPTTSAEPPPICEAEPAEQDPAPMAQLEEDCTCCNGSPLDHAPPKIRRAGFVNPTVVELVFSERIVEPTHVDPRQFRISLGMGYGYDQYASSYYTDPCTYGGGCDVDGTLGVRSLRLSENGKRMVLELTHPMPADLCVNIREYQREMFLGRLASGLKMNGKIGLFVHYTSSGTEPVRDPSGNELEDIGAHWALASGAEYSYQYSLGKTAEMFTGLIPLPCTLRPVGGT